VEVGAGVRISCRVSGDPAAPAVVLLHALGDLASDWHTVESAFAPHFHVVAPDLRGHGDSDWPGTYSFELMRDDVIEVLDILNLRDVILVGHSMGGAVAYLLAQAQPGRIARLVIEDTPPPFPRTRALPEQPEGDLPFDWRVVPEIADQVNDPTRRWWTHLPDVSSPTLLIGGGPTSHIPQNLLVEVAQLVPDCTLITINAGHNIHQTAPKEFIDALTTWLASRGSVALSPRTSDSGTLPARIWRSATE
jgi:3-oxoadipate enol-lactonase